MLPVGLCEWKITNTYYITILLDAEIFKILRTFSRNPKSRRSYSYKKKKSVDLLSRTEINWIFVAEWTVKFSVYIFVTVFHSKRQ